MASKKRDLLEVLSWNWSSSRAGATARGAHGDPNLSLRILRPACVMAIPNAKDPAPNVS